MPKDELEILFDQMVKGKKKEETEDEQLCVDSSYFGSGLDGDDFSGDGEALGPDLSSPALHPVGTEKVPDNFDWGFSTVGKNVEIDELELEFSTYSENRSFQADVISFIERYYYDKGELPEWRKLHEVFSDYPERPRYLKGWANVLESIQNKLDVRGLPTFRTAENYLDPKFIAACHLILNPHDKRTDAAKLKALGDIKPARWNAWLKRKSYMEYYKRHAEKIFDEELQVEAQRALGDLVRNRDLSAIKYLDERTGVYRSNNGSNVEVIGAFMQAMFAILARTVSADVISTIQAQLREEPVIQELLGNTQNAIEAKAS